MPIALCMVKFLPIGMRGVGEVTYPPNKHKIRRVILIHEF
jgi:hypothetical protein